jgi:hypothetical protein
MLSTNVTATIDVPAELIPENLKKTNIREFIQSCIEVVLTEDKFITTPGKGYKKDGSPIEGQADLSLAGHILTVLMVFLSLLKLYLRYDEKIKLDENSFKKIIMAIILHDINKYLGKDYNELSSEELKNEIENFANRIGYKTSKEQDYDEILCIMERVEKSDAGAHCRTLPKDLREMYPVIKLIRAADAIASCSSEIPVYDYRIVEEIEKQLKEINELLGVNNEDVGQIHFKKISNTIYNLGTYITLLGIIHTIEKNNGTPILASRNSVIYFGNEISNDDIVDESVSLISKYIIHSRRTREKCKQRPNQSDLDCLAFYFRHDEEFIKAYFSDDENQKKIREFFERCIWAEEASNEILSIDDIFNKIEENGKDLAWVSYLLIYSLCNENLRKEKFLNEIFDSKKIILPNSRRAIDKYKDLSLLFKNKLLNNEWLCERKDIILREFIKIMEKLSSDKINPIRELIKFHLQDNYSTSVEINKSDKSICAICGNYEAKRPYGFVVNSVPPKELVSNFYPNLIKRSMEDVKLCDYCYAEFLLRCFIFERDYKYYLHASPSVYFPIIALSYAKEGYSIGELMRKVEIEGELVNPVFMSEADSNTVASYFMIAQKEEGRKRDILYYYYKLFENALNLAKFGFRVSVTRSFSNPPTEKAYLYFEPMYGELKMLFGNHKFYLMNYSENNIEKVSNIVSLIRGLRELSGEKEENLINSIGRSPLSSFHFLMSSFNFFTTKDLEVGSLAEKVVEKYREGKLLPILEKMADVFLESMGREVDLASRNSRTWPIREAFDAYIKFQKIEGVKDVIASQILKYCGIEYKERALELADSFSNLFTELVGLLKSIFGTSLVDPSTRTYIIDTFDYYVTKKKLEGEEKHEGVNE